MLLKVSQVLGRVFLAHTCRETSLASNGRFSEGMPRGASGSVLFNLFCHVL